MSILRPCRFKFENTPAFDGFAYGTKWNGFDNVSVSGDVMQQIAEYFIHIGDNETVEDLMSISPDDCGLISLAGGYATRIVAIREQV